MIYFDTSYLVRLYYQDPGADAVRALAATDHIACAAHGQAEMFAAFHRKFREGAIRPAAYAALIGQVQAHIEDGAFHWLAQDLDILSLIRHVYEKLPSTVFLRAADAIHLATAADSGFRIVFPLTRTCSVRLSILVSKERTLFRACPNLGRKGLSRDFDGRRDYVPDPL